MVKVAFGEPFRRALSRLDKATRARVLKQIKKIVDNPAAGKPMRYCRKGTREVYIPPFRLSYAFLKERDTILLLAFYHKKKQ